MINFLVPFLPSIPMLQELLYVDDFPVNSSQVASQDMQSYKKDVKSMLIMNSPSNYVFT